MATPPVLEILIYALVLSGSPAPMACEVQRDNIVRCTNGATATWDERAGYATVNAVPVIRNGDGKLVFGNGITSARNAFGWTRFTNGVSVRRDYLGGNPDAYYVQPSLFCAEISPTKAACRPR